jgi:hypothetical protein
MPRVHNEDEVRTSINKGVLSVRIQLHLGLFSKNIIANCQQSTENPLPDYGFIFTVITEADERGSVEEQSAGAE